MMLGYDVMRVRSAEECKGPLLPVYLRKLPSDLCQAPLP